MYTVNRLNSALAFYLMRCLLEGGVNYRAVLITKFKEKNTDLNKTHSIFNFSATKTAPVANELLRKTEKLNERVANLMLIC